MENNTERYVGTAEAARILGLQASTLRKWKHIGRNKDKLPVYATPSDSAMGHKLRYKLSDVYMFLGSVDPVE